jgi:hypothetical protein
MPTTPDANLPNQKQQAKISVPGGALTHAHEAEAAEVEESAL